jgi:LPS export ABC transporter permease LptG/LPS export ABC transporter permease LptF
VRILTRYILREILSHAFIGGVLFTFVLFMPNMGKLLEIAVRNSSSLQVVAKMFLLTLPNIFVVVIPMSVLVGILLGLSRLAADSEITAIRASGIGVWKFVGIVSLIAVAAWGIGLANSLFVAPWSSRAMIHMEKSLTNSQASYEVQPRVFYENFKNYVLYVEDVKAGRGAAHWDQVFIANLSNPSAPTVTTAQSATVISAPNQTILMRLHDGTEHQMSATHPGNYNLSTFTNTDIPLRIGSHEDVHFHRTDKPILAMNNSELLTRAHGKNGDRYWIEFLQRLAYPSACLVLMLIGIPLGIASRRGGKSGGFVLTIALVFIYYFLSSTGTTLARQHKIPPLPGVWAANIIFALCGIFLLRQMATGGAALNAIASIGTWFRIRRPGKNHASHASRSGEARRTIRGHFPLILDEYVIREFIKIFLLVLVSFVLLMLFFTFFELVGDIIRHHAPLTLVGEYLINLAPSMIYMITPLAVLIAVLVVFGLMNRSSEITAIKATGISLYRIVLPIFVIASLLAVGLFVFNEYYVPQSNRRQQALRNIIQGKPAQTYARPGETWIFGKRQPHQPRTMFYYQYFDPGSNTFFNLSVFEFDPVTFQLVKRSYAQTASWDQKDHRWILQDGWTRTFHGDETTSYQKFEVTTLPEMVETPHYFEKDIRPSSEMSFAQLRRYIADLSQSGFDTVRLRVQLNRKLADPLITLVMAILAIPFALFMGKRGSLAGIGVAIGVAIAYWVISGMFQAMGDVNMLPAILAAWSPDILFALAGGYLLLRTST